MKFLLLIFLVISSSVFAQSTKNSQPNPESCAEFIKRHCPNEKIPGEIVKCLLQHENEISVHCKQEIQRTKTASEQASERGGGALSAFGGLNSLTPPFPVITYEGRYSPGGVTMNENKLNFSTPIYQTEIDYLAISAATGHISFEDPYVLDSGVQTPTHVDRAELGAQFNRKLPDHKTLGLRASVGYAGDHIFEKFNDTTFSLSAQYSYPTQSGGLWMWSVFLSNNSPLGNYIPIPGVSYFYRTETFTGIFGFPVLSLQWTPVKLWSYSFSMFGPSIKTEAAYGALQKTQYFANLAWSNQSFLLRDRANDKDRFTIEEKKMSLGARALVLEKMQAEFQVGYAFDRALYIGKGLRNMRGGSTSLSDDIFLAWSLKKGF